MMKSIIPVDSWVLKKLCYLGKKKSYVPARMTGIPRNEIFMAKNNGEIKTFLLMSSVNDDVGCFHKYFNHLFEGKHIC